MATSKIESQQVHRKIIRETTTAQGVIDLTQANMGMTPSQYTPIGAIVHYDASSTLFCDIGLWRDSQNNYTARLFTTQGAATNLTVDLEVLYILK